MKCPQCGAPESVIDSRHSPVGTRRRRVCDKGHRRSTYEIDAGLLFRMAKDVLMEPGFFMKSERKLESTFHAIAERPLKVVSG